MAIGLQDNALGFKLASKILAISVQTRMSVEIRMVECEKYDSDL